MSLLSRAITLGKGHRASPGVRRHDGWAEGLNFLGPRVRTSFWGWALLALGVLGALHAADRASAVQAEQAEAEAIIKRLQRGERQLSVQAQAQAKAASAAQEARAASTPELKPESWRQAAQLAQWLGYPWADTLDHVDAASFKQKAVLIQFSLDLSSLASNEGVQPDLKLQAAVADDKAALQWLEALGPQAMLRTREALNVPFNTSQGTYAWRLDVITTGGLP